MPISLKELSEIKKSYKNYGYFNYEGRHYSNLSGPEIPKSKIKSLTQEYEANNLVAAIEKDRALQSLYNEIDKIAVDEDKHGFGLPAAGQAKKDILMAIKMYAIKSAKRS